MIWQLLSVRDLPRNPILKIPPPSAHTHTHTHARARTRTRTRTRTHARTHAHTHAHTHTDRQTQIRVNHQWLQKDFINLASQDLSKILEAGLNSSETNVLIDVENDSEYEVKIFLLERHNLM